MNLIPPLLLVEARREMYLLIDKHLRKLPKNPDGTINFFGDGLADNDVDALRHSYVSGVFTQEYSESAADIFGRLYETFFGGTLSSSNSENSTNMDLWNNNVGRKYGKKSKTRKELFKNLLKALKNGELIIDPNADKRKFGGNGAIKDNVKDIIIVLQESKKGKNRTFFDPVKNQIMNKKDYVALIKDGTYPNYEIRIIKGDEIPVSKGDNSIINNLG